MSSFQDQLSKQFYNWEIAGRGWFKFDNPVDLEPVFQPFDGYYLNPYIYDDALKPSLLKSIFNLFSKKISPEDFYVADQQDDIQYYPFEWSSPLKSIGIKFPKEYKIRIEDIEQWLVLLSQTSQPFSFEITGIKGEIHFTIACSADDQGYIKNNLNAYFPFLYIYEVETSELIVDNSSICLFEFGLQEEFMRPIKTSKSFDPDPYIPLLSILNDMKEGERACFQILAKGVINPWGKSILTAVSDGQGGSFFPETDMLSLAKEKVSSPLFAVSLRCFSQATDIDRAITLNKWLARSIIQNSTSAWNSLIILENDDLDSSIENIINRVSNRTGMLLNAKELSTLLHFPDASVHAPNLRGSVRKTIPTPETLKGNPFILGANPHLNNFDPISIQDHIRLKHTHIIGATGTGKSTLLLNLIAQDAHSGNGFCVLDPHGDLIESILPHIPRSRFDDVILIDPADTDYPVAFNILEAHSEVEKEILSSDLVSMFRRLSTSWGDQMNSVFANAILAHLESSQGGNLTSVRRFLIEKPYRDAYLNTIQDEGIKYYWTKEFPLLKTSSIGPILTRLDTFLRPKLIRNMVSQDKGIDFETLINSKKIILVKLSEGLIGKENSYLLGTMIVSKIHQAAMARQLIDKSERSNFYLYIDEFQHFITP